MDSNQVMSGYADLLLSPDEVLHDYFLGVMSRQASIIGRREVMSGRAKFGIFGDGKEIPQLAMARVFEKGDFRSGYYRDQTLLFALGASTVQEFFAQLYAHADVQADPASAGRAMNAHFATRSLDDEGKWKNLTQMMNSSSDIAPTASQMPRLVGLAYASRLYRQRDDLHNFTNFSNHGNEVAFGTIGNASCAEGLFWESINAIGVLKSPAVIAIYDDGYGISVPNALQIVKENLYDMLCGFKRSPDAKQGFDVYLAHGWNYPELVLTFRQAVSTARKEHIPAIIHIVELTQPQGHSTSGSHERYKSPERLAWEAEYDGLNRFRRWILAERLATSEQLDQLEAKARQETEAERKAAWSAFITPIRAERDILVALFEEIAPLSGQTAELARLKTYLQGLDAPLRRQLAQAASEALFHLRHEEGSIRTKLAAWRERFDNQNQERYDTHLYDSGATSALNVAGVPAEYSADAPLVYGYDIINACFDLALQREPRLVAFGEDVGKLGDVNQGFHGLQEKFGNLRVSDTGIREATILGQAIGLALRGLRPIAEIQYLDYLLYALQLMSDDLATLFWRTQGGQRAPVIVRTRGHRLEGIWHSGSPMAGIIHLVRGMYVLVPRNMTQAAGFYNTLLRAEEPALVVEPLNSYRSKERLPSNIGEFCLPLGVPEILRRGADITLVTYGACCKIVLKASERLALAGIDAEVIDVQSLLPFDRHGLILESLKKTGHILFIDEDVPGGATATMLQEVIENQGGFFWLDSPPRTLTAKAHRPAYGSDGDYWSKPNVEQVFERAYRMMHETNPKQYPLFF